VTAEINNLSSSQPYTGHEAVHIGNGACLSIAHKGIAILPTLFNSLVLTNVLHVPAITKNLLSISKLICDNNVIVEFSSHSCFIKDQTTHKILLHGILHNGLYRIIPFSSSPQQHSIFQASHSSSEIWHARLAHCFSIILDSLRKAQAISIKPQSSFSFCSSCSKAKAHKLPFLPSEAAATQPLEVVHYDLWGPAPVVSNKGNRYYVLFTDEFIRFTWFYPCACKADVSFIFAQFKSKVENLLSSKIKLFQCDGGSEFKPLMRNFPEITFQVSCPYTPKQNGLAERKHRHIVELGLAYLFHASIPLQLWDLIFESVVYVINRLPSMSIGAISPFQKLFSQKPDYIMLHPLSCTCFPLLRPYTQHKLEPRSDSCVFLGYSSIHKGYYCYHLPSNRLYVSRHVVFNELEFPFLSLPLTESGQES
jgi:GAG-pre-integrase domain